MKKQARDETKSIGVCNRSKGKVYETATHGYAGYSVELDEDLYEFEFTRNNT